MIADCRHLWLLIVAICDCWLSPSVIADCRHLWLLIVAICDCWLSPSVIADCCHLWLLIVTICDYWLSPSVIADCHHLWLLIVKLSLLNFWFWFETKDQFPAYNMETYAALARMTEDAHTMFSTAFDNVIGQILKLYFNWK